MARLVDNYHMDEKIMKEIASHELLVNVQQLVSSSDFIYPLIHIQLCLIDIGLHIGCQHVWSAVFN